MECIARAAIVRILDHTPIELEEDLVVGWVSKKQGIGSRTVKRALSRLVTDQEVVRKGTLIALRES